MMALIFGVVLALTDICAFLAGWNFSEDKLRSIIYLILTLIGMIVLVFIKIDLGV